MAFCYQQMPDYQHLVSASQKEVDLEASRRQRIYQLDLLNLDTETVKNLCALPDLDAGTENKYMVTMNARIKLKKLKGTKEKDIGYRDTSNIQYRCHKLENRMTVEVPATVDEKWTALKGKDHKGN